MIATIVQHHPSRDYLLPALLERLPVGTIVVTDPDPGYRLPNPWRTYRACLEQIPDGATHACIVQDDIIPHPDFSEVLPRVVAAKPDRIICVYCGGIPILGARSILLAQAAGSVWAELPCTDLLPVVATCWPVALAHEFLAWADKRARPSDRSDDGLASTWIRQRMVRPVATVPSLVDHPDVEPSLIGKVAKAGKDRHRVAVVSPEGQDILTIEW